MADNPVSDQTLVLPLSEAVSMVLQACLALCLKPPPLSLFDPPKIEAYIDRLPYELLLRIFHFAVAFENPLWPYRPSRRTGASPFVLSQVCTTWRQLAIQSGSLWTKFDINVSWYCISGYLLVEQMRLFLERSGGSPIVFRLNLKPLDPELPPILRIENVLVQGRYGRFRAIYNFLSLIGLRWKSVGFDERVGSVGRYMLNDNILCMGFNQLKHLSMETPHFFD